jgi:GSH-dependent disulfide-bond oxidoreductase
VEAGRRSRSRARPDRSIADMAIMPWLRSFKNQGVDMDEYHYVKAWFEGISARPAVQRALEVLKDARRQGPLTPEQRANYFGDKQYAKR